MYWRTKAVSRFGGASPCSINIADYDPEQEGLFKRLNISINGEWKSGQTVMKNCSAEIYITIDGIRPHCESDGGGTYECSPPSPCAGCTYTETREYSGETSVTAEDAAEAARSEAETDDPGWSAWTAGIPVGLHGSTLSSDAREPSGASFLELTYHIEFAGAFRPFLWRTEQKISFQDPATSTPAVVTYEWVDYPFENDAAFGITFNAEPNITRSINRQWILLAQ